MGRRRVKERENRRKKFNMMGYNNITSRWDPQLVGVVVLILPKKDSLYTRRGKFGFAFGFLDIGNGATTKGDEVRKIWRETMP